MKKNSFISLAMFSFIFFCVSNAISDAGAIRGEVHYTGEKQGPIIIAVINLKMDFDNLVILDTLETGPGLYEIANLKEGTYLLAAYMDVNGDGLPSFVEPLGAHPKAVKLEQEAIDSVDIYINELARGGSSISGTVTYSGTASGKIHVYALGVTGTPFNHISLETSGFYKLEGLQSGEYIITAFLDTNDNGKPDVGEPVGYIAEKIKVGNSDQLSGFNIELFDPMSFNGSIYGKVSFSGTLSGTVFITTVGLSHTPFNTTKIKFPETQSYEVNHLDQGDYYVFAFLDTNSNGNFNPKRIEIDKSQPFIPIKYYPGEPYELIAEPIQLAENGSMEVNLVLSEVGDASISGNITYNGKQKGPIVVAAIGLSPSWFGLGASFAPSSPYGYTVLELDAGYYAVIGIMISDFNADFDDISSLLKYPIGFYTKELVHVKSHENVTDIDFFLDDSSNANSSISGTITTPAGVQGDIHLFSLGISLTPYWSDVLTTERTYTISSLRLGRYLIGGFMDVNGNKTFDLNEPFAITESLQEIAQSNTFLQVNLDLKVQSPTTIAAPPRALEPDQYVLGNNYPNPFNPTTSISYQLAESRTVSIKIINLLGHEVRTLIHKQQAAGQYEITWDGKDNHGKEVSSGVYLCCMKAGGFVDFKKMTLIR